MQKKKLRVLLIDDDEEEFFLLKEDILNSPYEEKQTEMTLEWVDSYEEAVEFFSNSTFDAYLVDYRLGERNGLELIQEAIRQGVSAPIIMLTGQGSYEVDLAAMEQGASDYLVKGQLTVPLLERSIRYAIERKGTQNELEQLVDERTLELARTNESLRAEISRRKSAEDVLRESEEKFRVLADTTSAAIFIIQDFKICYANPSAKTITGYPIENLIGTNILRLTHPTYRTMFEQNPALKEWSDPVPARYELQLIRKDGEIRWVDVALGRMLYAGQPAWVLTVFDITERELAEKALRNANQQLAQSKEELEEKVAGRTRELRTKAEELEALNQATSALLTTLNLDKLLGQILDAARSALPVADLGILNMVDQNHEEIQGHLSEIVRVRLPRLVPDCMGNAGFMSTGGPADGQEVQSLIGVPLLINEECIGVLALGAYRPQAFTEADLRLLTGFAATATAAIQNARLYDEVQKLSITDALTGLYNRRGLVALSEHEFRQAKRYKNKLGMVMFDIDHFKVVNDSYGHPAGDEVLKGIAQRVQDSIRSVDILARYGGEEFAVLLPDCNEQGARELAERLRQIVADTPLPTQRGPVSVTISLGVAEATAGRQSLANLIEKADDALYQAKKNGRNRVAP